jgi:hypothetical protein
MNLNPRKETIIVQDEFLLSTQGLVHKVGGVTLKGTSFGADGSIVKAGTAIMKEAGTGKFVLYADNAGAFPTGAEVYILAQDQVVKGQKDMVAGAVVQAYLNSAKLIGATTAFKGATNQRYIFG